MVSDQRVQIIYIRCIIFEDIFMMKSISTYFIELWENKKHIQYLLLLVYVEYSYSLCYNKLKRVCHISVSLVEFHYRLAC